MKCALSVPVLALVAVVCVGGCLNGQSPSNDDVTASGNQVFTLQHGGVDRRYILHVPGGANGQKTLPLVVVLHGGGGNAANAAMMSRMSDKADKEGFAVMYPEGTGRLKDFALTWNSGNCCGFALENGVDDVGFIEAAIDDAGRRFKLDSDRIYATGISNGAMMSYALGCERPGRFAAIAPVAGALNWENCTPDHPVSVVIFHGTADQHVLYEGGKPRKMFDLHERVDKPVSYAVDFWVRRNGCNDTPRKMEDDDAIVESYDVCQNGTGVALYTVKGGGHVWPGGNKGWLLADEPAKNLPATDIIWDFFKSHPKA